MPVYTMLGLFVFISIPMVDLSARLKYLPGVRCSSENVLVKDEASDLFEAAVVRLTLLKEWRTDCRSDIKLALSIRLLGIILLRIFRSVTLHPAMIPTWISLRFQHALIFTSCGQRILKTKCFRKSVDKCASVHEIFSRYHPLPCS